MNVRKVMGDDGHFLQGEVYSEGHVDMQCGPWHPGMLHTCALKQLESCKHLLRFQLRHTGLPACSMGIGGDRDRVYFGASWGGPELAG